MKKLWISLALVSLVGVTGSSFANTTTNGTDQNFVEKATQAGLEEVKTAQLVQSKTQNSEVINLANTLIQDHSQTNQELTQKAQNVSLKVPQAISPLEQEQYDRLNRLEGRAFERQYLQNEINDHEKAIQLFKFEASNGKNSTLKTFASSKIPVLQHHLDMTRQTLNTLDNSPANTTNSYSSTTTTQYKTNTTDTDNTVNTED